jgi:hypothetical protein
LILGHFSIKEGGKVVSSGAQTISVNPRTGRLRSWMSDNEGGHGEALWYRDGNRWALDAIGVLPDGTETTSTNIITRLADDAFLWRSVDRTAGTTNVPDTAQIRVTRVTNGK